MSAGPRLPRPPDELAIEFVDRLRRAGVRLALADAVAFVEALVVVGMQSRRAVWNAGRVTLVHRAEDLPVYDSVFADFWDATATMPPDASREPTTATTVGVAAPVEDAIDEPPDAPDDEAETGADVVVVRASAVESLRAKDFAACSASERDELLAGVDRLRVHAPRRASRRRRPSRHHARGEIDLRATLRASRATGGEVTRFARASRRDRPRRIVLLLDVSGSMSDYSRLLLRFAHALATSDAPCEAFTLGTRMTRITRALAPRDADAALAAAAQTVADWSGGTRLGEGLRRFNDDWGVRGMARGATVVVVSDGWERGDPARLGVEMARLRRVAHRVVWVNPLKASPGYEPLARGMAAALPHVDRFVEGHSLESLASLIELIGESA